MSSFTIIAISIERCYAVYDPINARIYFDEKRTLMVLGSIWLSCFIISLPFLWMVEFTMHPNQCQLNLGLFQLIFILMFNAIFIFMPAVCLLILYVVIISKIIKRNNDFHNKNGQVKIRNSIELININFINKNSEKKQKQELNGFGIMKRNKADSIISNLKKSQNSNYSIVISIIAIVFYCGQLPLRIFLTWSYIHFYLNFVLDYHVNNKNQLNIESINFIFRVSYLVYFLHCISNPIIYNFLSTNFRESLRRLSVSRRSSKNKKKNSYWKLYHKFTVKAF